MEELPRMENVIRNLKEIHKNSIILIRIGTFYHAYGKDAYIMSYLFNYQIKNVGKGYNTCGMPVSGLNKVLKILEDKKIDYLVLIKSQNYDVETKKEFNVNNRYLETYEKAYRNINLRKRINSIYDYLIENIEQPNIKTIIQKVEDCIDTE